MERGFIKLFRNFTEWEWYDDIPTKVLFVDLLFLVNWKDKKWHGRIIKRGELITSLDHLAEHSKLSKMQVRTALKKLQTTGEIEVETTKQYTHIKIVNYSKYQNNNTQITHDNTDKHYDSEEVQHTDNTRITHEQHTNNTQITLTKEYKELKEREEERLGRPLTPKEELELELPFRDQNKPLSNEEMNILLGVSYERRTDN